jgi:hypothetical protein
MAVHAVEVGVCHARTWLVEMLALVVGDVKFLSIAMYFPRACHSCMGGLKIINNNEEKF